MLEESGTFARLSVGRRVALPRCDALRPPHAGTLQSALGLSLLETYAFDALRKERSHPGSLVAMLVWTAQM
jgi:hypothetical protein